MNLNYNFNGDNVTEYDTAEKILKDGKVKSLVVTRGRSGVSMYQLKHRSAAGESYYDLDKTDMARIDSELFIDSTGCGDVFAASFFYKNAEFKQKDQHLALNFANKMASLNASLHGVEDLKKLKFN
jgi:sugar/nucleoside kinase (ribokinase family)